MANDNIVVLSTNSYTVSSTDNPVVPVNTYPAPSEVTVLNDVQMINNTSGVTTQYWSLTGSNLYPISSLYSLTIGGSGLVTDEALRVIGKLNATSISIGTDTFSIYTSGSDMYLKDGSVTKKLSDFGGVGSVTSGNGMNFTAITGSGAVTMGTPSAVTSTSTNAATGTTHTHAIDATIVNTGGSYSNPAWITALSETKVLPSQAGNNGKFLTTNGSATSWGGLNLASDVLYWDAVNQKYTAYAAQAAGKFDSSLVAPTHTNRLNYDGHLYATRFVGEHYVGGTSGDLAYTNGTNITTGVGNYNGTTLTLSSNVKATVVYVGNDTTYLSKDGSNNLTLTDANSGSATLAALLSGATNYWTSNPSGIYYTGNVAIGTTFVAGAELSVTGEIAATNFLSSIYRWRNSNICIGPNAGDAELNSNRFYCDITNTSNPMLYGDFDSRYWTFNADTYWAVNKKQYFSSTTNQLYADASNNLTFKDGVAASGVAIPLVNLINGTYNALKADFTSYATVTAISAANVSNWNTAYTKSSVITVSGAGTSYLTDDGTYKSLGSTVTLNNNILEWYNTGGYYRPYTTKGAGHFYNTDTTDPSSTNQLFYDGYFYATRLHSDDLITDVLKTSGSTKTNGYFYTGTTNPDNTTRLNYDGYLRTTQLYGINATAIATWGVSTSATGVQGESTSGIGVRGISSSGAAIQGESVTGVSGVFSNSTGSTANILEAQLNYVNKFYVDYLGNINSLVLKSNGSTRTAGYFYTGGVTPSGTTVLNYDGYFNATQLEGNSLTYGVKGTTTSGYGCYGYATNGYGVYAQATTGTGLYAQASSGVAVSGSSATGVGLVINHVTGNTANLAQFKVNSATKFAIDKDGNTETLRGNYIYHRQTLGSDTDGDWREYSDASGLYIQYRASGVWVTKTQVTI